MNSFQICQLIIIRVDAYTKEQPCITPIYNLERAEFDKIGLMLLISRRNQAMHFTLEFNFFLILWVGWGAKALVLLYIRLELKWRGRTGLMGWLAYAIWGVPLRQAGFASAESYRILTSCLEEAETE